MKQMMNEVKDIVIRLKSLQQTIRPITVGAGCANSPYIYVIFDKEACAQFGRDTSVYLSWKHLDTKVKGYNVFTRVSKKPNCWKITLPQALLHRGHVLARIELVDGKSISASRNFEINVLQNPNTGSSWTQSDDFSVFQQTVMDLTKRVNQTRDLLEDTRRTVRDMNDLFVRIQEYYENIQDEYDAQNQKIDRALSKSYKALCKAMDALNAVTWGEI